MKIDEHILDILEKLGINKHSINHLPLLKISIEKLKNINVIDEQAYQKINKLINKMETPKKLYKTHHPIIYFNVSTQNSKYYENWGWYITSNLYTINNDPKKGNKNKIYSYVLNLIKFFELVEKLQKQEIDLFYNNFYDFKNLKIESFVDYLTKQEISTIQKVITFLKRNFKKNYEKSTSSISGIKNKYKFTEINFKNDEDEQPYKLKIIKQTLKTDEEEIEEPIFYQIDEEPEPPSKKDSLNKYYKKISILKSNIHLLSSQNSITLNEVLFIYKEFNSIINAHSERDRKYQLFLCLAILSLNTGILISEWIEILCNKSSLIKFLKTEEGIFFYQYKNSLKAHIKSKKMIEDFIYDVNDKIRIYFPGELQLICQILNENKKILKKSFYINSKTSANNQTPETIYKQIKKQVSKLMNKLNKKYTYSYQITEERIRYFFFNYYIDKYDLDTLFAEYISIIKDDLSNSQQHYTTINTFELNKKLIYCYKKLKKDLQISLKSKISDQNVLSVINRNEYIGSLIVLKKKYITEFFDSIYNYLNSNNLSPIEDFNLRNIYLYFLLQLTTGHRPIVDPEYNERNYYFSENFSILIIRDKTSMPRPIPLCKFLNEQLNSHSKLCINTIKNYKLQNIVNKIFFMLIRNNDFSINYKDFSKKNLNKIFFENLCGKFSYLPPNFLRHYFRTYLSKKNLDSKFIDWLMGHYVLGQEMLNKYLTINIQKFRTETLKIQEELIKEHGIQAIY